MDDINRVELAELSCQRSAETTGLNRHAAFILPEKIAPLDDPLTTLSASGRYQQSRSDGPVPVIIERSIAESMTSDSARAEAMSAGEAGGGYWDCTDLPS